MKNFIQVKYDMLMDEANYKYSLIDKSYPTYGRSDVKVLPFFADELRILIDSVDDKNKKMRIVEAYLDKHYKNKYLFNQSAKNLEEAWNLISNGYTSRLLKYFEITKYAPEPVTCYLTTLKLCPYDRVKRYFYTSCFTHIFDQVYTMMHELMHIIFLDNYEDYLISRGLSKQSILDINESLVELLNLEFSDLLMFKVVNNKPSAEDLMSIVVDSHKKQLKFREILELLIVARL